MKLASICKRLKMVHLPCSTGCNQKKKKVTFKAVNGSYKTPNPLDCWALTFQPTELWKTNFCCLDATPSMVFCFINPNGLWYISRITIWWKYFTSICWTSFQYLTGIKNKFSHMSVIVQVIWKLLSRQIYSVKMRKLIPMPQSCDENELW